MGVSDLREAFNGVASPRYTASAAFLETVRDRDFSDDTVREWSRLTFSGIGAEGSKFEIASDLVPAGADVILAARATAQKLLDLAPPAAPAEEPPTP